MELLCSSGNLEYLFSCVVRTNFVLYFAELLMIEQVMGVVDLKQRSDVHWARKIWHMGGVSLIAGCYAHLPHTVSVVGLVIAWLLFVPVDYLRLSRPALNDFLLHIFGPIMRENEINKIAGTSYLLSGLLLVVLIFPANVALLTMLFLAFADPIASYFGIRFGKDKIFFAGVQLQSEFHPHLGVFCFSQ